MRLFATTVLAAGLALVGLGCDNVGTTDPALGPPDSSTAPGPGDPVTGDQFTPDQPASDQSAPSVEP